MGIGIRKQKTRENVQICAKLGKVWALKETRTKSLWEDYETDSETAASSLYTLWNNLFDWMELVVEAI